MQTTLIKIMLWAAAAVTAVVLGATLSFAVFGPPQTARVGALEPTGQAQIGGPFQLVDHTGRAVDESVLQGRKSLVYFGFTFCPDFCPMELANMAAAADLMKARGEPITTVFITIDPERDTQEVMKEYVESFSDDMIGLTGDPAQIDAAARAYKVIYRKAVGEDFVDGYTMEHTTFLYAMDENGAFLRHFTYGTPPEKIVQALGDAS